MGGISRRLRGSGNTLSVFYPRHLRHPRLITFIKPRPYLHRPFDDIDVFKDLEPKVVVQLRMVAKKLVNYRQSLFIPLTADKSSEPIVYKKDLTCALQVGKLVEGSL